jgi:hypothetical protein
MTGMRPWIWLTGSTAGAVMTVQLVMPSFLLWTQSPANENR